MSLLSAVDSVWNQWYSFISMNVRCLSVCWSDISMAVLDGVADLVTVGLWNGRKEGNVLFNDALNTFYLWLYGVRHMVKDHSDSEKETRCRHIGYFPINSKGSFICTIPQTG